jgi:hypothetical protein
MSELVAKKMTPTQERAAKRRARILAKSKERMDIVTGVASKEPRIPTSPAPPAKPPKTKLTKEQPAATQPTPKVRATSAVSSPSPARPSPSVGIRRRAAGNNASTASPKPKPASPAPAKKPTPYAGVNVRIKLMSQTKVKALLCAAAVIGCATLLALQIPTTIKPPYYATQVLGEYRSLLATGAEWDTVEAKMSRDSVDPEFIQMLRSSQDVPEESPSWVSSVLLAPFNVVRAAFGSLLALFTESGSWSTRPPLLLTALAVHLLALGLFSSLKALQCIPMGAPGPKKSAGILGWLGLAKFWGYYQSVQGAFNSFCLFVATLVVVLSARVVLAGAGAL